MNKRDYYDVLGVTKTADGDSIKKAYRKMAMQYHPDKNPGDKQAEDMFKEASEAYEVLSDPQKRAQYDRFGHAGMTGAAGGPGGAGFSDINDIFSRMSDIFEGSGFESFFGGGPGGRRRRQGQPGSDLRIKIKLSLEEIAAGVEKKIKLKRQVICGTCAGTGAFDSSSYQTCPTCSGAGEVRQQVGGGFFSQIVVSVCPTCHGEGRVITRACTVCNAEGRVESEDTVSATIPAGVSEGMQLSLRGQGNAGKRGGPPGDLLVQFEETPHEHLVRNGDNLVYDLHVSFADAALGLNAEVPTLGGKARFKIDPGTQSGEVKRLKGKGLPNINGYGVGDQIVYINVWTPKAVTAEERALLEKMRKMPNFNPTPNKSDKGFFKKMREFFT